MSALRLQVHGQRPISVVLLVVTFQDVAIGGLSDWRIAMLAETNGFPTYLGQDDFGFVFGGPALNGKTVSIKRRGDVGLAMRVPSVVLLELRKDAGASFVFQVYDDGLVLFSAEGELANKPIRRAAALIRAQPSTLRL
jgi:hypothetical protein